MKTVLKNSRPDQLKVDDIKIKGKSAFFHFFFSVYLPFQVALLSLFFLSSAWLRDCL